MADYKTHYTSAADAKEAREQSNVDAKAASDAKAAKDKADKAIAEAQAATAKARDEHNAEVDEVLKRNPALSTPEAEELLRYRLKDVKREWVAVEASRRRDISGGALSMDDAIAVASKQYDHNEQLEKEAADPKKPEPVVVDPRAWRKHEVAVK